MKRNEIEKNLRLIISAATEHNHRRYVITIAICRTSNRKEINYGVALAHDPEKIFNALTTNSAILTATETSSKYGKATAFVIQCEVVNVGKERVVRELSEIIHGLAYQPTATNSQNYKIYKFHLGLYEESE